MFFFLSGRLEKCFTSFTKDYHNYQCDLLSRPETIRKTIIFTIKIFESFPSDTSMRNTNMIILRTIYIPVGNNH